MPITIRPYHGFLVFCPVTYHAGLHDRVKALSRTSRVPLTGFLRSPFYAPTKLLEA
jgi:hypothetical protein